MNPKSMQVEEKNATQSLRDRMLTYAQHPNEIIVASQLGDILGLYYELAVTNGCLPVTPQLHGEMALTLGLWQGMFWHTERRCPMTLNGSTTLDNYMLLETGLFARQAKDAYLPSQFVTQRSILPFQLMSNMPLPRKCAADKVLVGFPVLMMAPVNQVQNTAGPVVFTSEDLKNGLAFYSHSAGAWIDSTQTSASWCYGTKTATVPHLDKEFFLFFPVLNSQLYHFLKIAYASSQPSDMTSICSLVKGKAIDDSIKADLTNLAVEVNPSQTDYEAVTNSINIVLVSLAHGLHLSDMPQEYSSLLNSVNITLCATATPQDPAVGWLQALMQYPFNEIQDQVGNKISGKPYEQLVGTNSIIGATTPKLSADHLKIVWDLFTNVWGTPNQNQNIPINSNGNQSQGQGQNQSQGQGQGQGQGQNQGQGQGQNLNLNLNTGNISVPLNTNTTRRTATFGSFPGFTAPVEVPKTFQTQKFDMTGGSQPTWKTAAPTPRAPDKENPTPFGTSTNQKTFTNTPQPAYTPYYPQMNMNVGSTLPYTTQYGYPTGTYLPTAGTYSQSMYNPVSSTPPVTATPATTLPSNQLVTDVTSIHYDPDAINAALKNAAAYDQGVRTLKRAVCESARGGSQQLNVLSDLLAQKTTSNRKKNARSIALEVKKDISTVVEKHAEDLELAKRQDLEGIRLQSEKDRTAEEFYRLVRDRMRGTFHFCNGTGFTDAREFHPLFDLPHPNIIRFIKTESGPRKLKGWKFSVSKYMTEQGFEKNWKPYAFNYRPSDADELDIGKGVLPMNIVEYLSEKSNTVTSDWVVDAYITLRVVSNDPGFRVQYVPKQLIVEVQGQTFVPVEVQSSDLVENNCYVSERSKRFVKGMPTPNVWQFKINLPKLPKETTELATKIRHINAGNVHVLPGGDLYVFPDPEKLPANGADLKDYFLEVKMDYSLVIRGVDEISRNTADAVIAAGKASCAKFLRIKWSKEYASKKTNQPELVKDMINAATKTQKGSLIHRHNYGQKQKDMKAAMNNKN